MNRDRRIKKITIIVFGLFFLTCIATGASAAKEKPDKKKPVKWVKSKYGVKALMKLSKDRGEMVKEFKQETENYRKIKKAIACGQLEKGESATRIESRYGSPVVSFADDKKKTQEWVYKPGNVSFFSSEKIYLIFDKGDKLIEWKLPQRGG
ncbi:MAG: hypothetical protein ABID83_02390 [Candidatus Omnitrophota bacterium]